MLNLWVRFLFEGITDTTICGIEFRNLNGKHSILTQLLSAFNFLFYKAHTCWVAELFGAIIKSLNFSLQVRIVRFLVNLTACLIRTLTPLLHDWPTHYNKQHNYNYLNWSHSVILFESRSWAMGITTLI